MGLKVLLHDVMGPGKHHQIALKFGSDILQANPHQQCEIMYSTHWNIAVGGREAINMPYYMKINAEDHHKNNYVC